MIKVSTVVSRHPLSPIKTNEDMTSKKVRGTHVRGLPSLTGLRNLLDLSRVPRRGLGLLEAIEHQGTAISNCLSGGLLWLIM